MDRKIGDYLPGYLLAYREFQKITDIEQERYELFYQDIDKCLSNSFIEDADEEGIKRYERILRIVPNPDSTLEERRFKVKLSYLGTGFYTLSELKNYLGNLLGRDEYNLELKNKEYLIKVRVALTEKKNFVEVEKFLKMNVPANIVIDLSLLYNTHKILGRFTHGQLKTRAYKELRNEVL